MKNSLKMDKMWKCNYAQCLALSNNNPAGRMKLHLELENAREQVN